MMRLSRPPRAPAGVPAMELRGVSKVFPGGVMALRSVDLAVAPGERACLLGPNGAGKTTVVRLLEGALRPTSGTVRLSGVRSDTAAYVMARRRAGVVPQAPGMYDDLRLGEYLELVRRLYRLPAQAQPPEALGLAPYLDRPLAALSGGLQRRATLGAALLPQPPLLILDEPTVGLDPVAARDVRHALREAMADRTALLCTHNLAEAEDLCDSVIILRQGRVVLHERIDHLKERLTPRVQVAAVQGADALRAALARLGVAAQLAGDDERARAVEISSRDYEREIPGLLRGLLNQGVDVYEARVLRPTLEDAFFTALQGGAGVVPPADTISEAPARGPGGPRVGEAPTPVAQPIDVAGTGDGSRHSPPLSHHETGGQGIDGLEAGDRPAHEPDDVPPDQRRDDAAAPAVERRQALREQVLALLWKEVRQIPRKRSALLSATLLPLLFFVILPASQLFTLTRLAAGGAPANLPAPAALPPALRAVSRDPLAVFRILTFPLVVLLGGLFVPSVMAVHTVVVERERRTLDLLVALPVSLAAILWAKLLAVLLAGAAVALPLFALDAVVAWRAGLLPASNLAGLLVLLLAALAYSTSSALVVGLVAGDFRTANNVSGAMLGPPILLAVTLLTALAPGMAPLLLSPLLLVLAAGAVAGALRWLTVERLLR